MGIGATLPDIKGQPVAGLEPGKSNPAEIPSSRGGTARNVAENLARLGAEVVLVSAVGDDTTGRQLMIQTAEAGVNLEDLRIDHGLGQPFGLAEIMVVPAAAEHLQQSLEAKGWRVLD